MEITDLDYKHLQDVAFEVVLDKENVRHYLDNGDPIERLDTALDQAQGGVSIDRKPQFIVIKVY